jgi:O-antigen/teichoic acid export membrane protein
MLSRQSLLQAEGKAFEFAFWELVQLPVSIGLSLYLIIVKEMLWEGRIIGILAGMIVSGLCSIFMFYKDSLFTSLSLNAKHAKHALSFGIPLIPHALFGILAITANQFIANRFLGVQDVGIYSIASQLSLTCTILIDPFVKVYGPWLNKSIAIKVNPELIVSRIFASWLILVASAMIIALLLLNISPFFIGSSFAKSRYLIPILCCGGAFTGCYYTVSGLFFYTSKTFLLPIITTSAGIVSILMSLLMVNYFGLYGLAFSLAFGQALQFSLTLLLSRKAIRLPWIKGIKTSLCFAR